MNGVRAQVESALEAAEEDGLLPLVPAGHPVLRHVTEPVDGQVDEAQLDALIEAMRRTMRAAPGVGLAAPQVGIGLRLAVMQDSAEIPDGAANVRERQAFDFRAILNARYTAVGDERRSFYEGCLSVPGYQAVVERPRSVRLQGVDAAGRALDEELVGWPARIAAHEIDHLDGVLYLDRAQLRSLASDQAVAALWSDPSPELAARVLGFPLAPGQIL